jgi:hypothetical protein
LLQKHLVRLACIRHTASVHPEPGSNSPQKYCHLLRDVKYGVIHWNYRLLLPITFQLLRYLPFKRTVFYPSHNRLSRIYTDKNTDALSFHIGSSDCKTTRLVSLTGDGYSVVNDLSQRRDLFGMYWQTMIICTSPSLSIVIRHLNLKKSRQFSAPCAQAFT